MMQKIHRIFVVLGLTLLASTIALGSPIMPAATVVNAGAPSNFGQPPGPFTIGWSFELLRPYTVAYLGWFEASAPLAESHDVNLWQCQDATCGAPTGGPIASATIDSSDVLSASFRWEALATPVSLTPGFYVVSGFSGETDPYIHALSGANVTFDPTFRWIDGRWLQAGGAAFPGNSNGLPALSYFGPNVASVPEPGTIWALGGGLVLMLAGRRRRA